MGNKIHSDFNTAPINIGISEKDRKRVCRGLDRLLIDSYHLFLKTQNYHWNVTGKMFRPLHTLFEEQYNELLGAIDHIAERIRALGDFVQPLSSSSREGGVPTTEEMILNLVQGNESLVTACREIITLTDDCEDDVTAALLVDRMQIHEKNAWMLRSMLEGSKYTH